MLYTIYIIHYIYIYTLFLLYIYVYIWSLGGWKSHHPTSRLEMWSRTGILPKSPKHFAKIFLLCPDISTSVDKRKRGVSPIFVMTHRDFGAVFSSCVENNLACWPIGQFERLFDRLIPKTCGGTMSCSRHTELMWMDNAFDTGDGWTPGPVDRYYIASCLRGTLVFMEIPCLKMQHGIGSTRPSRLYLEMEPFWKLIWSKYIPLIRCIEALEDFLILRHTH